MYMEAHTCTQARLAEVATDASDVFILVGVVLAKDRLRAKAARPSFTV